MFKHLKALLIAASLALMASPAMADTAKQADPVFQCVETTLQDMGITAEQAKTSPKTWLGAHITIENRKYTFSPKGTSVYGLCRQHVAWKAAEAARIEFEQSETAQAIRAAEIEKQFLEEVAAAKAEAAARQQQLIRNMVVVILAISLITLFAAGLHSRPKIQPPKLRLVMPTFKLPAMPRLWQPQGSMPSAIVLYDEDPREPSRFRAARLRVPVTPAVFDGPEPPAPGPTRTAANEDVESSLATASPMPEPPPIVETDRTLEAAPDEAEVALLLTDQIPELDTPIEEAPSEVERVVDITGAIEALHGPRHAEPAEPATNAPQVASDFDTRAFAWRLNHPGEELPEDFYDQDHHKDQDGSIAAAGGG